MKAPRASHPPLAIGIRDVTDADLPFVANVLNHEIETSAYVYAETPVTLDERRAWLRSHREAGFPVFVAVDEDDAPLGWASLSPYRSASGYRFTVEASVYVSMSARGCGVAGRLVAALEIWAIAHEKRVAVASIDAANGPSIELFKRFDYAEVARLPNVGYKFGTWRTQLLLAKTFAP